jgi:hypothetical protein
MLEGGEPNYIVSKCINVTMKPSLIQLIYANKNVKRNIDSNDLSIIYIKSLIPENNSLPLKIGIAFVKILSSHDPAFNNLSIIFHSCYVH